MKIAITHSKNPATAWNIAVSVQADSGQKISDVEVRVNGFSEVRETPSAPLDTWEQQLTQKGVFPGDNKVEVAVHDQDGQESRAEQKWDT
jgi:hypothetical protein